MGTVCSNGAEILNETENDLDLTPSDKTYQFVFKKDVRIKISNYFREVIMMGKIANFIQKTNRLKI